MANPVILFNSATGSDVAASGAGPGTAVTGTGASLSSSTSINLSADSPDLSGVATDGSAVLWVKTSSGRQFSKITAVDNGTKVVTVATAYGVTESGRTWAIGGKRATIDHADSRILLTTDVEEAWTVQFEDNGSASLSAIVNLRSIPATVTSSAVYIRGASEWITCNQTFNGAHFATSGVSKYTFENIKFTSTAATKTNAVAIRCNANDSYITCRSCIFGDATDTLTYAYQRNNGILYLTLIDCEILECTGGAGNGNAVTLFAYGVYSHDNGGAGLLSSSGASCSISNSIIANNTGNGITLVGTTYKALLIANNTIDGNGGDGIELPGVANFCIFNNQISNNGAYGIESTVAYTLGVENDFNNFYNNTSGSHNGVPTGANSTFLDPQYTNAAGENWGIGTNTKAKGYPLAARTIGANNSATSSYLDIGAAQRQESGGGGLLVHPGLVGGFAG